MTAVKEIYKHSPDMYLDELVWWLAIHHDIVISVSGLHRNLVEAGLTRKLLHKIAFERDEILRAEYHTQIGENSGGSGEEFVCVDEVSKNDHHTAHRHGRALSGEQAEFFDYFVQGQRYSLVAAITTDGYLAAQAIPGSFDSDEFYDFIVEQVVSAFTVQFRGIWVIIPQIFEMNPWPAP